MNPFHLIFKLKQRTVTCGEENDGNEEQIEITQHNRVRINNNRHYEAIRSAAVAMYFRN